MPRRPVLVPINPPVLRWARETAGQSPESVARRLKVDIQRVRAWETKAPNEQALVSPRQLEELARLFRRPTAALFLDRPPEEPTPPRDFRRALHREAPFSADLRLAIRRARRLQRVASVVRHADRTLSKVARARVTFSRMSEAFAVQTNGFGWWL